MEYCSYTAEFAQTILYKLEFMLCFITSAETESFVWKIIRNINLTGGTTYFVGKKCIVLKKFVKFFETFSVKGDHCTLIPFHGARVFVTKNILPTLRFL